MLKLHIDETFDTSLIWLPDELDGLFEVGPLLSTLTGFLDDRGVNTSFANASRRRRVEGLFAHFFGLVQPLLQLNLLLLELLLHGLALTLLCLLLLGHVLLKRLVLLSQLHVLLHGLVEQLELAVEVRGSLWAQAGLLRRTCHLLIVDRKVSDNLLDTLLLNSCIVGLWSK